MTNRLAGTGKPTGQRRAGMYLRISQDTEQLGLGVKRQEEDCRKLAAQKGWSVAELYCDNDVSAWKGKRRPQWERMLDDIKNGVIDAVLVYDLDRLARQPRDLERFFDVCDASGLTNMASVAGSIDLSTGDGKFHARIMGAVAAKESDDKSRRIRRKAEELAKAGKPAGMSHVYGYERIDGNFVIVPEQAERIREATDRILAGDTLGAIWRDWIARGVPSAKAKTWTVNGIKRVLLSARIAGLREHHGTVVGPATWEPIITADQYQRLRTILLDESRQKYARVGRRYLLTGLLFCGNCGEPLRSRRRGNKSTPGYECAKKPGSRACGKLGRKALPIEEFVTEAVLTALDGPGLAKALKARRAAHNDDSKILDAIQADEAALEQLAADFYTDALISRAEFFAARSKLTDRIDANRQRLAAISGTAVLATVMGSGDELRAAWTRAEEAGDLDKRRAILKAVIDRVIVKPVGKGNKPFDPESVEIVWLA